MSKPAGGGKTSDGIFTVLPAVTDRFETVACAAMEPSGVQSRPMPSESALMEIPAVSGSAGTGCKRNSACCAAINAKAPEPDCGRSNASNSASHQAFQGADE